MGEGGKMSKYISQFLQFKCAGDVINAVTPVQKMGKEITEAMAIRKQLRKIVLPEPMKYMVLDFCAGNGLAGILSVFTLPVRYCIALDIRQRDRLGFRDVKRWSYLQCDISRLNLVEYPDSIIISSHPCGDLAKKIIDIYNSNDNVKALISIPCCLPSYRNFDHPQLIADKFSFYDQWSMYLYQQCIGKRQCIKDNNILSPANNVIYAVKNNI